MSTSTLAVSSGRSRKTAGVNNDKNKSTFQEPKRSILLVASLWIFQSIFSACKMEFTGNLQGTSISFHMQDVVLLVFAAWMLSKGLSTRNVSMVFPWVTVSIYGLYYNHYKGLQRMMAIMKTVRHATALPWLALFITGIGLGFRVILILRTLQLSANLWYRKKVEKEVYDSFN